MRRPAHLGPRGKAFWLHVTDVYELTEVESQLLAETCRTLDTVESLERAARDADSRSERLQVLREARQQRLTLGVCWGSWRCRMRTAGCCRRRRLGGRRRRPGRGGTASTR